MLGRLTKFFLAHAFEDVTAAGVPFIFGSFLEELSRADNLPVEVELEGFALFFTISAREAKEENAIDP